MRMKKAEREEERYTELLQGTEANVQVSDTFLLRRQRHDLLKRVGS